ncbi:MAG: sigma-70 family RNA polymerase sigma factor [Sandaracinaceae bacterium]|nr:sigma-70 family RNA polymerase sigma factor [Sandaracinaceae bacterium]
MSEHTNTPWSEGEAKAALTKYEPLVRGLARRLEPLARAGRGLDHEDLVAEGRIAVLDALATFEGYGVPESTWVRVRVRQRMIDAIRRLDPRTRGEMRLLAREGDDLAPEEVERCRAIGARHVVSIDACGPREPAVQLADAAAIAPDEAAHESRQRARLRSLLDTLPGPAKLTLEARLFEGASLGEIGERLGVSAARVCQIQTAAVRQLHQVLAA